MNSNLNLSNRFTSNRLSVGIALILMAFALGLNFYTTHQGVGASPDSAVYIGAADSLLLGLGLRVPFGDSANTPLTQYPPLYPLLVALSRSVDNDPRYSIRILNLLLLSGNLVLFWIYAKRVTFPNKEFASLLIAPLAAGISFLTVHIMAWSEALFLLLGFSGLYLIATASTNRISKRIWIGSLLLSLSALTRYAGIAFIFTATLFIFFHPKINTFSLRLRMSSTTLVIGLLPPAIWSLYNQAVYDSAFNRTLSFHPIQPSNISVAIHTIANWFFIPIDWSIRLKAACLVIFLVIGFISLYRLAKKKPIATDWNIPRLLIFFFLMYALFLTFSISFIDANTPLDDRILSPIFFSLWLLFGFIIHGYRHLLQTRLVLAASIILLAYPILSLIWNNSIIQHAHQNGIGFYSKTWQQSETIAWISKNAPRALLFSNTPEGIYLNTGISTLALPKKKDLMKNLPNAEYSQQLRNIGDSVASGKAAIIFFTSIASLNLPSQEELIDLVSPIESTTLKDGIVIQLHTSP